MDRLERLAMKTLFFISFIFALLLVTGCQGTRVVIGNEPQSGTSPGYGEKGPPPWAPAHGYRAKHRYRYYPSQRVYHDRDRGLYFYYRNGQWEISVSLPSDIHINVNDYVTLEMNTDRPYEYNDEVVKRYPPGQLKKKNKKKKRK
jgi:hypothetical protein